MRYKLMKINQVEELTGITKKNIRFYEEQKLINPQRNPANGYREYSMEDVKQLSRIKLLRKLGIPIESIRKMETGELKLDDCLFKKVHELKADIQSARMMQAVCQEMLDQTADFDKIDTELYLAEIDKLEKGGTQFMKIEQYDKRPSIFAPVFFAGITILAAAAFILLLFYLNSVEPAPFGVIGFFVIAGVAVCVGVIIACRERIKEIKGGELDEARNY
ncbi:MAG: MerR family transcriptional regulator [Lachnospiraceae bacterium]|nr:MerR family transcriptional regulator [Lachnospiraceae bacterium]